MKSHRIYTTLLCFMMHIPVWAADAIVLEEDSKSGLDWTIENIIFILGILVIVSAFFVLYNTLKSIWKIQTIQRFESQGLSHRAAIAKFNQESFLGYIYQQLDGGVTLEQEADVLLHHDYDGIQELDNNLPPWWVGMFYLTVLFAPIYIGIYHFSSFGLSQAEEYEQEVKEAEIAIAKFYAAQAAAKKEMITADNVSVLVEADRIAAGEAIFQKFCAVCHGKLGEGVVNMGQNLTDEYWIHGGGIKDIFKTISNGVPGKQMIPWKTTLNPSEIQEVSSFIVSIKGSNPPNARPAEGVLYEGEKTEEVAVEKENEIKIN